MMMMMIIIIIIISPNHGILPCSLLYTLISIFPDAPRADIGPKLLQRPQPVTIPNNNFHIINTSRRSSCKNNYKLFWDHTLLMDKSVHYIRPNKTLVYITNNKSAFSGRAIAMTHNRQITSIETQNQYKNWHLKSRRNGAVQDVHYCTDFVC
jgi:hypothetical protein